MHLQSVNFTEELLRPGGGSDGGPSTDWQDGIRLSKRGGYLTWERRTNMRQSSGTCTYTIGSNVMKVTVRAVPGGPGRPIGVRVPN